MNHSINRSINH